MRIRMVTKVEERLVIDYGRGVVRYWGSPIELDGATLHADPEAKIFTDEPEWVCLALRIPFPDPQVIQEK
jgi:hypothetical protein